MEFASMAEAGRMVRHYKMVNNTLRQENDKLKKQIAELRHELHKHGKRNCDKFRTASELTQEYWRQSKEIADPVFATWCVMAHNEDLFNLEEKNGHDETDS